MMMMMMMMLVRKGQAQQPFGVEIVSPSPLEVLGDDITDITFAFQVYGEVDDRYLYNK